MKKRKAIPYGPLPCHLLDLYLPDEPPRALLLWFHGGGLEAGSREDCAPYASFLAGKGIACACGDYRMYPDAHFPDFVEDAALCAAYLYRSLAPSLAVSSLFVGGSSAGAYLTQMLWLDKRYLAAQDLAPGDFAGFIPSSAQPTVHYNILRERGLDPRLIRVDEAAPVHFVSPETAPSLPPALFLMAEQDIPVRTEQNLMLRSALIHCGMEAASLPYRILPGYTHCGYDGAMNDKGESVLGLLLEEFMTHVLSAAKPRH